ncbi:Protein phosphatase PTC7-like protein [Smittium culicis]|uniref:Protein phosphatase n=1 Tax=Smittium culicis TaxID=133412 RepID=A0A1R1XK92_9FUNG|nr:Protein phosphatase PTC7-like protein [Smittium culicis]
MPSKLTNVIPKFSARLTFAHLSKKSAAAYVAKYRAQLRAQPPSKKMPPFELPIRVQTHTIAPHFAATGGEIVAHADAGEDSFFCAANRYNAIFGVADGVGGWNESGIDPSVFARTLTNYCAKVAASEWLLHETDAVEAYRCIALAYSHMRADPHDLYGSSTITAATINMVNGALDVAQIGDSNYAIFDVAPGSSAPVTARYVSPEHQHKFNMPFQLTGKFPPPSRHSRGRSQRVAPPPPGGAFEPQNLAANPANYKARAVGASSADGAAARNDFDFSDVAAIGLDTPNDAVTGHFDVGPSTPNGATVVLLATDGLFDNVFNDEILAVLAHSINEQEQCAYQLVQASCLNYLRSDLSSPFSERAKSAGYSFNGGKPDDVTLVLAVITTNEDAHCGSSDSGNDKVPPPFTKSRL